MSERKVVVPTDMQYAFGIEYDHQKGLGADKELCERRGLEAALRWLSENPIVPTHAQWGECSDVVSARYRSNVGSSFSYGHEEICEEWQRRMFLSSEPEVPEEVKDLLDDGSYIGNFAAELDRRVIEAFRRGQNSMGGPR